MEQKSQHLQLSAMYNSIWVSENRVPGYPLNSLVYPNFSDWHGQKRGIVYPSSWGQEVRDMNTTAMKEIISLDDKVTLATVGVGEAHGWRVMGK